MSANKRERKFGMAFTQFLKLEPRRIRITKLLQRDGFAVVGRVTITGFRILALQFTHVFMRTLKIIRIHQGDVTTQIQSIINQMGTGEISPQAA